VVNGKQRRKEKQRERERERWWMWWEVALPKAFVAFSDLPRWIQK
jgi:hypothetical protein